MTTHLYIICGHGHGDSGATGNGYTEAERVRALGARIAKLGGSNVTLLDTSRNWYADNGISSLTLPKGSALVELHMDSGPASAKGGHVIIKAGHSPDEADNKLAAAMKRIFPGRSNSIVGRSDLANVNRAAKRGINYRLVENGFISNAGDVKTFNSRMDEIAKAYLDAFGIPTAGTPTPAPAPAPKPKREPGGSPMSKPYYGAKLRRLYNPKTADHMYTPDAGEANTLVKQGWLDEGNLGTLPEEGRILFRMYNTNTGEHYLTIDYNEAANMAKNGWISEGEPGVAHRKGNGKVSVYRLFNPNATSNTHLFTTSANERDTLAKSGWKNEGEVFALD